MVVSRDGKVINLRTGHELNARPNDNGYMAVGVWVRRKNEEWYKNFNLHQVLALAFIAVPEHLKHLTGREITVNHKDTNKHNNALGNLEWMTSHENTLHAHAHGLGGSNKPVLARDVVTAEIKHFVSINDCARVFDLGDQQLRLHLSSPATGTLYHAGHVFKLDDDNDWPEDFILKPFIATRAVIGYHVDSGIKVLDASANALCLNLKLNSNGYGNHIKVKGVNTPYHGWVFREVDLSKPEDMTLFKEWSDKPKSVHHLAVQYQVINTLNNTTMTLVGLKAVVDEVGYSSPTVLEAIRLRDGRIGAYLVKKLD